ncbi:MAG: response regulator [Chitinophagaceae bacterium]|nr:response regulator [Chitinophagaceae bacterium]
MVTLIAESKDFQLGKVFASAEEAIPHIHEFSGIVIIDIKLPGMNGAKLVSHITQANKDVQCIICSMYDDDEFIFFSVEEWSVGLSIERQCW